MSSTAPDDGPTPEELARTATPATLRRAPRYRGFAFAGVLVGVLAAVVAVVVSGPARDGAPLDTVSVVLLLAVVLGGFGALLGTAVAVLVDRRSLRASRRTADDAAPPSA
ncbi:hypothetical protein [Actinotalea sp. Marseille-Q4924]|uniref:hypothetical protein n=1 Tax=Actinotalea sp. Marseille-Q4924 TaxID=2866571 RepID=UPI001CE3BBA9|nr:hypothetical protein [Actinotalea sp. Marseille-Q4924]